jgi:hypothetical protein
MSASRRALLAGAAALPAVAAAAHAAVPSPHPDAELVDACDAYMRAVETYNRSGSVLEYEDDPLFWAVTAAMDRIHQLDATTMAGVVAMASVAEYLSRQPDGSVNYSDSFTGDFPAWVIEAVLRLNLSGQA